VMIARTIAKSRSAISWACYQACWMRRTVRERCSRAHFRGIEFSGPSKASQPGWRSVVRIALWTS
jgi:hypothetical protein